MLCHKYPTRLNSYNRYSFCIIIICIFFVNVLCIYYYYIHIYIYIYIYKYTYIYIYIYLYITYIMLLYIKYYYILYSTPLEPCHLYQNFTIIYSWEDLFYRSVLCCPKNYNKVHQTARESTTSRTNNLGNISKVSVICILLWN